MALTGTGVSNYCNCFLKLMAPSLFFHFLKTITALPLSHHVVIPEPIRSKANRQLFGYRYEGRRCWWLPATSRCSTRISIAGGISRCLMLRELKLTTLWRAGASFISGGKQIYLTKRNIVLKYEIHIPYEDLFTFILSIWAGSWERHFKRKCDLVIAHNTTPASTRTNQVESSLRWVTMKENPFRCFSKES